MAKKRRSDPAQVFDVSLANPAFADYLRMAGVGWGGIPSESDAVGLTAFYRAVALISGTIAGLPLRVYERTASGRQERDHFLSRTPAGPFDMSQFVWTETILLHQLMHGECFLKSIENNGGEQVGLWPIHPLAVEGVRWDGPDKMFTVTMEGGRKEILATGEVTHIPVMSTDGLRGKAPLSIFRNSLQTARNGEAAASRSFTSGALISGLVTTEEDVDSEEAKAINESLKAKMTGTDSAGSIAFVNRALKFSPWKMSNVDAQFLESRRFGVEEIARMFGLPTHLLSVSGATSNWGTGVSEANLALQKYVLMAFTSRIESGLQTVLPPGWFAEFDYRGLLQGNPAEEINLLIAQVGAGLLTLDEARTIMNRSPLPESESLAHEVLPHAPV